MILLSTVAYSSRGQTSGPADQPAGVSAVKFKEQYEAVKKVPLLAASDDKTEAGVSLSAEQKAKRDKSAKLLKQAEELRQKGEFDRALELAAEALTLRRELFGATHFSSINAVAEEKTLRRYTQSPRNELNELAESDRLMAKAQEAFDKSEYASAVNSANKALTIRERILGRGHHELGDCYRIIGGAQTELLSFEDAERSLEKAVDIAEKAYGENHPVLAKNLDRQAWLYINTGDLPKAQAAVQTAVRIYGLTVGDTLDAADAIDNYGTVLVLRGDPAEGLNQKLRALIIRETVGGPDSKDAGISYSNLAWLFNRIGANSEVIPLRRKSVSIFDTLLGPDHPYTNAETVSLGVALQADGKMDEAIELYQQAISRDEKRPEPVDARVVNRQTRLGVAYFEAGRRDDADAALKKSIEKAKVVKGLGQSKAAAGELKQVADVYEAYRMLDEAAAALDVACKWDQETGSSFDDGVSTRVQHLGSLLVRLGRAKDAKGPLEKALQQATQRYGPGDRKLAGLLLPLAQSYEALGDWEAAEKTCNELLKISESKYGTESRGNAIALREMGRVYLARKKLDLARFSLEDAKRVTEKYQDLEPVEMIFVLFDYADLQAASGESSDAAKSARDALERSRKLAGKSKNPNIVGILAKAIKKVIDADSSAADRETLRSELRQLLTRLRAERALDAENRQWLQELGESASKS
jgi:tetratricopeptide (TPR) repeat protein